MALAILGMTGAMAACSSETKRSAESIADTTDTVVENQNEAADSLAAEAKLPYDAEFFVNKANESQTPEKGKWCQTPSGLKYAVISEGDGPKPTAESTVTVHYAGELTDGTPFDSSYSRGEATSFPLNGVIKGWTEGLQLMPVGSTYEFFIPASLAYGENGSGPVPPNAPLLFKVQLISIDK